MPKERRSKEIPLLAPFYSRKEEKSKYARLTDGERISIKQSQSSSFTTYFSTLFIVLATTLRSILYRISSLSTSHIPTLYYSIHYPCFATIYLISVWCCCIYHTLTHTIEVVVLYNAIIISVNPLQATRGAISVAIIVHQPFASFTQLPAKVPVHSMVATKLSWLFLHPVS